MATAKGSGEIWALHTRCPRGERSRGNAKAQIGEERPGSHTKLHRLEENLGAVAVELTAGDLQEIEKAASKIIFQKARLPESALKMTGL